MTELKFTVSTEDPEALLKLAEICKSIADTVAYGCSPILPDTIVQTGAIPPTTIDPELSIVPKVPGLTEQLAPVEILGNTQQLGTTEQTPFSKLIQEQMPPATQEQMPPVTQEQVPPVTQEQVPPVTQELDSKNRPWDERIHSATKSKLKKTGEWKLKRGVDPALVTQILNAAPVSTQEPAQTQTPAPDNPFTILMTNLTKWLGEGTMNMLHVNDVLKRFNVPSVEYLQTCNDPDLISTVSFKLVEQWNLLNPPA